jgi:hypothetical protein
MHGKSLTAIEGACTMFPDPGPHLPAFAIDLSPCPHEGLSRGWEAAIAVRLVYDPRYQLGDCFEWLLLHLQE